MTPKTTFEKIQTRLENALAHWATDIKLESRLQEDLGLDSLDDVEFIIWIDEEFNTDLSEEQYAKFITVSDVVNWIDNYQSPR